MSGDDATVDDDLEDVFELRLRGRKVDLVEVLNVLHTGHHVKSHRGEYAPPDYQMVNELVGDLTDQLDFDGVSEALAERLETGDYLVGESVEVTLVSDELADDGVVVSPVTAITARDELDRLIERTEGDDPDPLTDAVFRARDELDDALRDDEDGESA